jgi:hypothetical protein
MMASRDSEEDIPGYYYVLNTGFVVWPMSLILTGLYSNRGREYRHPNESLSMVLHAGLSLETVYNLPWHPLVLKASPLMAVDAGSTYSPYDVKRSFAYLMSPEHPERDDYWKCHPMSVLACVPDNYVDLGNSLVMSPFNVENKSHLAVWSFDDIWCGYYDSQHPLSDYYYR